MTTTKTVYEVRSSDPAVTKGLILSTFRRKDAERAARAYGGTVEATRGTVR